jgi:hypothetical protein
MPHCAVGVGYQVPLRARPSREPKFGYRKHSPQDGFERRKEDAQCIVDFERPRPIMFAVPLFLSALSYCDFACRYSNGYIGRDKILQS